MEYGKYLYTTTPEVCPSEFESDCNIVFFENVRHTIRDFANVWQESHGCRRNRNCIFGLECGLV